MCICSLDAASAGRRVERGGQRRRPAPRRSPAADGSKQRGRADGRIIGVAGGDEPLSKLGDLLAGRGKRIGYALDPSERSLAPPAGKAEWRKLALKQSPGAQRCIGSLAAAVAQQHKYPDRSAEREDDSDQDRQLAPSGFGNTKGS